MRELKHRSSRVSLHSIFDKNNPMLSPQLRTHESLEGFLSRHPAFGGWHEEWDGVPLKFRTCLSTELPPRPFVGSVRAIVLRGDQVLVVHSPVPILSVGGRCNPEESIQQTLLREVGEETGWRILPVGVIGYIHAQHLDEQRPAWGRPAPDFIDPLFAVEALEFDQALLEPAAVRCEFIAINAVGALGLDEINLTFLHEALRRLQQVNQRSMS